MVCRLQISVDGAVSGNAQRSAQETRATLRSAHHALSLLALSRPAEFVSTIAKEVAAFSPASSALAQVLLFSIFFFLFFFLLFFTVEYDDEYFLL